MWQEIREKDNQLKTQLQLRDEYFDAELKRRDQNLEDALKKRDEEWRSEIEKRDIEWRTILRDRDNTLKASMDSRDSNFMNSLGHCKQSFGLMSFEIINNRTLLDSLAMRHPEHTKSNAKILDWAMKTVSSKKKIPLPQIRISNYRPYTIVPWGVTDPPIPYTNPDSIGAGTCTPCTETQKDKTPRTSEKKELTPVEEVEEHLRMEAAKERAARNK